MSGPNLEHGQTFRGLIARKSDSGSSIGWEDLSNDDLMDGDVLVRVSHTTINYKDGLALTGKAPIIRQWPLVPGIDFAGSVIESSHADFKAGDPVILNGWGVGEKHHGGYAEVARVSADWLIHRPEAFTPAETMAVGTAGYTAMLCILALEDHGVSPDSGSVLVTGAAGGVGSGAVPVLAKLGYHVIASTGRASQAGFLRGLGAAEIIEREELSGKPRPLNKERWAGAIDVAGSTTLANVLSMTSYGGCVAACGLAQGMDLPTSVAPFILRGITLSGIDSVMAPKPRRIEAWNRLAKDLDRQKLASLTLTKPVTDVQTLAGEIIEGKVRGRVVLEHAGA